MKLSIDIEASPEDLAFFMEHAGEIKREVSNYITKRRKNEYTTKDGSLTIDKTPIIPVYTDKPYGESGRQLRF